MRSLESSTFLKLIIIKKFYYNLTHWETWHYLAKYLPIGPVWLWYALRSRSIWWFSPSNPTLTFGGFEGEKKKEMYDQLPKEFYPKTIYIDPRISLDELLKIVEKNEFVYPFAVKPNAGMMGFMFRKIYTEQQLNLYHEQIGTEYILQDIADYPLEVSVFYYRYPGEEKGFITGFLKKEYLQVTGDGFKTLEELISEYSRADLKMDEILSKNKKQLHTIIRKDQKVILSQALNLSRGGKMVSLEKEIDEDLLKVFDGLSNFSKSFYYGRYDIKCKSVEDLKKGREFLILEFNGSGAEPHHIYGNNNSLFQAYGIVLKHWKVLYKISKINNESGVKYWSFMDGFKFLRKAKKHFKKLKQLDGNFEY